MTTKGLTRRRFIATTAALATTLEIQKAAWALGFKQNADVCKLAAEQEEGPYYIQDEMLRSDLTEGKAGVPLSLRIGILDAHGCKPLSGAAVDIWSCDAMGLYSGFTQQMPMGPGGPPPPPDGKISGDWPGPPPGSGPPPMSHPTDKLTFLRGVQLTGSDGSVTFKTIIPGFYPGRTNHIHFRVRVGVGADGKTLPAGHTSHTGQVFFPEDLAVELMKRPPYSEHRIHRTTQAQDNVFMRQHGDLYIASIRPVETGITASGYSAELIATVDPTATPEAAERGRPGGPPPHL